LSWLGSANNKSDNDNSNSLEIFDCKGFANPRKKTKPKPTIRSACTSLSVQIQLDFGSGKINKSGEN